MWLGVDLSNKIDISAASSLLQMAMFMSAPDSGYLKGGWKPVQNSRQTFTENGISLDSLSLPMVMLLTMQ
jgi:hypothetical protein